MTRRIFLDTEWTAAPWAPGAALLWVGLADEGGRSWHGVSADAAAELAARAPDSGLLRLIGPDDPRRSRSELAAGVVDFCGDVDEFWVWVPTVERFAEWFRLDLASAADLFARYRDVDLQMLRALVMPWPDGWPDRVRDLHAAAATAGVTLPPRADNHLHPRVHVEWNRRLFELICQATGGP